MQKTAILITGNNQSGQDPGLIKMYGETLAELTFYRIRDIFDKVFIVVSDLNQKAKYEKIFQEDILISFKENALSKALAGLKACRSKYAFLVATNMPLIEKQAVEFLYKSLEFEDFDVVIPRYESGKIESLHAIYKVNETLRAIQDCLADEKFYFEDVLVNLKNVKYVPVESFKEFSPKLETFIKVNSEVDFQKVKDLLKKKVFRARLDKAHSLEELVKIDLETPSTIYFKVPGTEEEHEVRYDKRTNTWICDCKYFTMKGAYCSHILAAQEKLKKYKKS